ncbi:hypothetical protein QE152_g41128, partial [Popillia japonica]
MDDLLIATETLGENISILSEVCMLIRKNRLDNCLFLMASIEYLGYTISDGNIRPALSRVYDVNLIEEYDLGAVQVKDTELSEIKSKLANGEKYEDYVLISGLVMKPYDGRKLLNIPRAARKEVVMQSHE